MSTANPHQRKETTPWYARLAFTGTKVAYVATKNTSGGKAAIYIDGNLKTTVNLCSSTTQERATIYTSPTLTRGNHAIKIKMTSGKRVNVDAFKITPLAPLIIWLYRRGTPATDDAGQSCPTHRTEAPATA